MGFILSNATPSFAGTTGVLSGVVIDSQSHAPLANVRVTAAAPTGRYSATTGPNGFYSITGIFADTYVVSFELPGYETVSVPGISVFADQTQRVGATLTKQLRTIASVTSRSAAAFQPNQTTDTYTVNASQINTIQGTTFNNSEVNLITSLPGAYIDNAGFVSIHGGRQNEEGFQFEGIPYTEAYTNQFVNTLALPGLGLASAQLTPGAGNATEESNGTGTLNLVAKRGTYPAYMTLEGGVGTPGFTHSFNGEFSTADVNGRWSEYFAFSGRNDSPRYGAAGASAVDILAFNNLRMESDREFLNNFIYHFGKQNHESLQFFFDAAEHDFYVGYGGLDGLCFQTCNPFFTTFYGPIFGLSDSQLQAISSLYPGQTSPTQLLTEAGNRAPQVNYQPNATLKFQYTNNLNANQYLSLSFYRVNSVTTFDNASGLRSAIGTGDAYLLQGGQTTGGTLSFTDQAGPKHLIQIGADYGFLHPVDSFNSLGFTWLGALINDPSIPYAFVSPADPNCPIGPGNCGYAYKAFPTATQLKMPNFVQTATLNRQDFSLFVNDKVDFTDRLKGEFGVRMDMANYHVPAPGIDPRTCTTQYLPATWTPPTTFDDAHGFVCDAKATFNVTDDMTKPHIAQPRIGLTYRFGNDTAVRLTYKRTVFFPTLGSYNNVVPDSMYAAFNGIPSFNVFTGGPSNVCGITGFQVECRSFGEQLKWVNQNFDGVPIQPVRPETANNYELTLQHQFTKGPLQGVSLSLAPWYRHQFDTTALVATPVIGANGQPVIQNGTVVTNPTVAVNTGKEFATGVDFSVARVSNVGWSGQFTASYINEFSSAIPTAVNEDFFPSIPAASVAAGNVYRVGFLSPFQTTLAVQYKTRNGWRINPRIQYNIGYPLNAGALTSAFINGTAINIPNSNALPGGSAAQAGLNANCFVDPQDPGSILNPHCAAFLGDAESASAGGKLSHPSSILDTTIEYSPEHSR
ncbi:MAG: TonB-dependent receptor, partial [Candidatus Eremiobacteraeota bacterium]|nr:TonB-dependent receptor [Candidatus Eremiobacteraeota bacterium]